MLCEQKFRFSIEHTLYYLDQRMHNIYINNKFLYHKLTVFVTFAISK